MRLLVFACSWKQENTKTESWWDNGTFFWSFNFLLGKKCNSDNQQTDRQTKIKLTENKIEEQITDRQKDRQTNTQTDKKWKQQSGDYSIYEVWANKYHLQWKLYLLKVNSISTRFKQFTSCYSIWRLTPCYHGQMLRIFCLDIMEGHVTNLGALKLSRIKKHT